jgi:ribosome-associated protein
MFTGAVLSKSTIDSADFAVKAAKIAIERNCSDVMVLDLKGVSPAADYFVIATGTSDRQMRAIADEIQDLAKEHKNRRFGIAGYETGKWILLDYVDVVIHLMSEESRDYYALEMLWGDTKKITIK